MHLEIQNWFMGQYKDWY